MDGSGSGSEPMVDLGINVLNQSDGNLGLPQQNVNYNLELCSIK
jgi:hypothetical protein